jgi:hypothetical protein
MTKAETAKFEKAKMINFIATSDAFIERATLALYERQTSDEQIQGTASHDNALGFSGVHAEVMTSFAQQIIKSTWPEGHRLSPKQRNVARKILSHYTGQLIQIRDEKKGIQQSLPLAKSV